MLVGFSLGRASQFEPVKNARPLWRVSCGYERAASSAWAATAIARLHVKLILGQICGFNAEEAVSTIRIQPKVLFENG
jgi:hypothetical protein